ncbi:UNVERIFIED_CONTAM: hypothetical protein Sradi_7019600 [Sesamum radiatum]|uniref:DUF4283 domain-containing protein n=1 Tax=Sesamum radiatum TaxID=300843 RepID=A0AAW2JA64_SESRA
MFKFDHVLDHKRVIDGVPWAFERNLLIWAPVEDDDNPARTELNWVEFYIHVHELLLGHRTKEMAEFIGNQLGKFRDVDLETVNQSWGSALRIGVGIDVREPLRMDYVLEVELFINLDSPLPRDFAIRLHPFLKLDGEQMFSATPQLQTGTDLNHIYPSPDPIKSTCFSPPLE